MELNKPTRGGRRNASQLEHWPIGRLIRSDANPRTHSPEQVEQIAASISEFGFVNPILVGTDGKIIAGEGRFRAAQTLGLRKVPVIKLGHLSEVQRRALAIADNQLALNASWDERMLRKQLATLKDANFDLDLLGFDDLELARQLADLEAGGLTEEDEVPAVPITAVSRLGDLWLLQSGKRREHRLLCGDATARQDALRLLTGQQPPILMATDPPYGVGLEPKWREQAGLNPRTRQRGKVANDDRTDWSEAWALFPGEVVYVWHAGVHAGEVAHGLQSCGFEIRSQIIWVKQHFAISRGAYHWRHEPCWYAVRKGESGRWLGDRKQTTVWEVANLNPFGGSSAEENEVTGHGTQKPVEIMRRPILNHTRQGEACYDPFLGSGSTLIAAETCGRICYGMDIDPRYVDVAVLRWQRFTGKQAVLDGDRRTFDEIARARRREVA
jgi:DNA modification methylase/ParB-like chromosome segregation protein Spo0J